MAVEADAAETARLGVEQLSGAALQVFEPVVEQGLHGFFELLAKQPVVFLMLALALGYLLGRITVRGISLGPTACTLMTGVTLSVIADMAFGITYSIPGLAGTIFMLLFMYALGLKVGPQFFAGLRSGGLALVTVTVVVFVLNWVIAVGGAELFALEPGFSAGIIAGSHTVTAVIGVATTAVQSGVWVPKAGASVEQAGANIAAAYAITYFLSSVGTIILIRYLPAMFGRDPVADAQEAEAAISGGATDPLPGAPGSLKLGFSPLDVRAYRVVHEAWVGRSIEQLFHEHHEAPILRVVRDGRAIEPEENPTLRMGDVVAIRADVNDHILKGRAKIGPELDDPLARSVPLEAADVRVGKRAFSGGTVAALHREIGFGLQLKALFRQGRQLPVGPDTEIAFGDVLRLVGPTPCIRRAADRLGGRPIVDTMTTEVTYLAIAMLVGYLVGIATITVAGIPLALGTTAGCLLAGIFVSYFRSRNPEFGGPVSEGARSFLQDIGLNMFVAVLAANAGPKVLHSFHDATVIWVAVIGGLAALLPPLVAFVVGHKLFGMNSVVAAGATTGARTNTPGLDAICEESNSAVAAAAYPATYAIGTVLALIGGYLAMVLS